MPREKWAGGQRQEQGEEGICQQARAYLPETIPCELQDFQGIVGPLAFAVEFNVAGETFQFYLSKRE